MHLAEIPFCFLITASYALRTTAHVRHGRELCSSQQIIHTPPNTLDTPLQLQPLLCPKCESQLRYSSRNRTCARAAATRTPSYVSQCRITHVHYQQIRLCTSVTCLYPLISIRSPLLRFPCFLFLCEPRFFVLFFNGSCLAVGFGPTTHPGPLRVPIAEIAEASSHGCLCMLHLSSARSAHCSTHVKTKLASVSAALLHQRCHPPKPRCSPHAAPTSLKICSGKNARSAPRTSSMCVSAEKPATGSVLLRSIVEHDTASPLPLRGALPCWTKILHKNSKNIPAKKTLTEVGFGIQSGKSM